MLPSKELKSRVTNLKYRVIKPEINLCDICEQVYTVLKNNSIDSISRLRIDKPKYCYCSRSNEIKIEIFRRPNRSASFNKVGTLTLRAINKTTYETHSHLNSSLRNKKIGLWMYCLGADWCKINKLKLKSSNAYSNDAERLWKSKTLRKYYNLTKAKGRKGYYLPRFAIAPKRATKLAKFPKSSLLTRDNRMLLLAKLLSKPQ